MSEIQRPAARSGAVDKPKPFVVPEYCKGCGLCIHYCNKKVLTESEHLNKAGYHYADPSAMDLCAGCMVCALVCPEVAIEVYDG